jgi:O-antigen/teichoic acid export membrane protein
MATESSSPDQPLKALWRRSAAVRNLYGSTLLTESAILASQLIAYRLAASYLGKEGFSEYALARRTISLLQPAAILGLGVGIPRYVALAAGRRPGDVPDNYLASGLLIVAGALAVCLTLLNLLKGPAAFVFFGSAQYRDLIPAVGLFLLGLALHMACEGYFRGRLDMARANVLRFINLGIMPLIVFPVFGYSTASVLSALGAALGASSAVALLFTGFGSGVTRLPGNARELLVYSLGRVPADVMQLAFLSLPALLFAHFQGMGPAGLVAFSTSVIALLCSLGPPINSVLLPEASSMIGRGDFESLRRRVSQILALALATVTLSVVIIEVFATPIFRLYLGRSFDDAVPIVRVVILGAVPFVVYQSQRSVIDAFRVAPINSRNMLISFVVFLLGSSAVYLKLAPPAFILAAFVAGLYVLGILTLFEIKKICWPPSLHRRRGAPIPSPLEAIDTPS